MFERNCECTNIALLPSFHSVKFLDEIYECNVTENMDEPFFVNLSCVTRDGRLGKFGGIFEGENGKDGREENRDERGKGEERQEKRARGKSGREERKKNEENRNRKRIRVEKGGENAK